MDYFQKASTASTIDHNFYCIINNVPKINRNLQKKNLNQSQNNFYQKKNINADIFTSLICYKNLFQYFYNAKTLNKPESQLQSNKCHRNNLTFFKLQFLKIIWFILFIIIQCSFITKINATNSSNELLTCTRYQACSAEISRFPLLSETVGNFVDMETNEPPIEIEGSGQLEGSGFNSNKLPTKEVHFPLYDEFVSEPTLFDFNADAEITPTQICQCPQNEIEGKTKCTFNNFDNEHVMSVNRILRLAFCQPVTQLFKSKCAGRRALIRVIGQIDTELRETISSVNDTVVFCRCDLPMKLKLVSIEPWLDKYAFVYRCLRP